MLDPNTIRHDYARVKAGCEKRQYPTSFLDDYVTKDTQWRTALQEIDALKQARNAASPKGKPTPEQLKTLATLSAEIKSKQDHVSSLEADVKAAAYLLPNIPDADVPEGDSEDDNVVVSTVGTPRSFSFEPLPHDELAQRLDIMDPVRSAKLSGARFSVMKGLGARLERALIQFMLDTHTTHHGYTEYLTPALVKTDCMYGTGQFPKFVEDQYKIENEELWLSPTGEVQLTNLFSGEILDNDQLPLKVTGYTPCFRRESGSYGKDVKGLIRLHQFHKVELVCLSHPDHSEDALESLRQDAEAILKALELPYRVVNLCAGDLGYCASKTYDLEVWFPSQNRYREISSCSLFRDFQSRRAMIRYREDDKGVHYVHTLNGSGLPISRTVAALLENFQLENGTIKIPEALLPYLSVENIS